jgi:RNA polymerase sigma-70 factor (ECF subfamily)
MRGSDFAVESQNLGTKETTRSLVLAARDGDRAAFGKLYDRYARMVRGILLARAPTSAVDDLTQEVFLSALRRLSTLREPHSFGPWLSAIARNCANYYWRQTPDDAELKDEFATDNRNLTEAISILKIIHSLPDTYSETLILRLAEGMSGPEIAEVTGMTPGSVRVTLCRGMKLLREKLSIMVC